MSRLHDRLKGKVKKDKNIKEFYPKCGHEVIPIITGINALSLASYYAWKESKSGLCLDCWVELVKR